MEIKATAVDPTALGSTEVCNRQMRSGRTRANLSFRSVVWYPDLVAAVDWIAAHEWEGKWRKNVSHVGGHSNDWIVTELFSTAGYKSKHSVVGNGTYSSVFDELRPRLWCGELLPVLCVSALPLLG